MLKGINHVSYDIIRIIALKTIHIAPNHTFKVMLVQVNNNGTHLSYGPSIEVNPSALDFIISH